MERILISGAAGFIGFHLARRFLSQGKSVIGIDGMIDNDDLWLKRIRLKILSQFKNFHFIERMITERMLLKLKDRPDLIIHLAAVSGIERFEKNYEDAQRPTFQAAEAISKYSNNNFITVLYASSSSVYGKMRKDKFTEKEVGLRPISKYANTKLKIEEIFKKVEPLSIGLRFFTVYGEYGRPDMAYFKFAREILMNKPLIIYGKEIKRDFTHINDVVESVLLIIKNLKSLEEIKESPIINIGCGNAIRLEKIVYLLSKYLRKKPVIIYKKARNFDMPYTCSDNSLLKKITGYTPKTDIESGIRGFVEWILNVLPYDIRATNLDVERLMEFLTNMDST